nr:hypothetical protein [Tanacetum cinerariifolium]
MANLETKELKGDACKQLGNEVAKSLRKLRGSQIELMLFLIILIGNHKKHQDDNLATQTEEAKKVLNFLEITSAEDAAVDLKKRVEELAKNLADYEK